jgi:hypothetical protein
VNARRQISIVVEIRQHRHNNNVVSIKVNRPTVAWATEHLSAAE